MREYGRVQTAFWNHPKIRALSEDGRTAALYLLTSPHSNSIGSYLLPYGYAVDDLQWHMERVQEAFAELYRKGFAKRFENGRHIAICDFVEWNKAENPNVVKAMIKQFDQLPTDPAKVYAARGILSHGGWIPVADRKRLETLSEPIRKGGGEPFRKPEPEPEPEPETLFSSPPLTESSSSKPSLLNLASPPAREEASSPASPSSSLGLEGRSSEGNAEILHPLLQTLRHKGHTQSKAAE